MKVESARRDSMSLARGRGTYATKVCTSCRRKKIKCDEVKPVCGRCASSGRESECLWGRENGRKPRTEAHFEALRKRISFLESELEKCRQDHGGPSNHNDRLDPSQFRHIGTDRTIFEGDEVQDEDREYSEVNEEDQAFSQELCIPTQNLKLEEGNLVFHGNTAPFRFAPESITVPSVSSRFPRTSDGPKYVLLLDGVTDNQSFNPDLEWSRYLPSSVPLDRREHDKLLDLVFKFFTSWCLRIVPDLFLQDMHRALSTPSSGPSEPAPKTTHYSPMLHNALIAVGTAFSDDPRLKDVRNRQEFALEAKGYIEKECQMPNISVVHALSILASFHSGMGDQTLGYLYFGMSARISQALGLSVDCSAWVQSGFITEHDMFDRSWAHWTTFAQDVCWSLYVGRDFSIPTPSDSKHLPVPFVDAEFDSVPWHYPPSQIPPQPNLLSKTFAASCELLMIARKIMDVVNELNNASIRTQVNDELISNIDLQLNTWKSNLPVDLDITIKSRPTSTPHRLMMHCTYWWFFILLHRPFYHRRQRPMYSSNHEIDHVKLCKRAADNITSLLSTWRTLYTLRYAPITLVQTAFSAGTIYILIAVQATTGLRVAQESLKQALSEAQLCIEYLEEMGRSWRCAVKIAEILRGLMSGQLRAVVERRAGRSGKGSRMELMLHLQPSGSDPALHDSDRPAGTGVSSGKREGRRSQSSQRGNSQKKEDGIGSRGRSARPIAVTKGQYTVESGSGPGSSHGSRSPLPSSGFGDRPLQDPTRSSSISSLFTSDPSYNSKWGSHGVPTLEVHAPTPVTRTESYASEGSSSVSSMFFFGVPDVAGVANYDGANGLAGNSGMDPSNFLAMLGGEPLPNVPFLPATFDRYGYGNESQSQPSFDETAYSGNAVRSETYVEADSYVQGVVRSGSNSSGSDNRNDQVPMEISDSDLAILTQFWNQNLRRGMSS